MQGHRPGYRLGRRASSAGAVSSLVVAALVGAAPPTLAAPADLVVTTTDDDGEGSLRDALRRASASPEDDRITFAPDVRGTILLTTGQLEATVGGASGDLTIEGPGREVLAVDAAGGSGVLAAQGPGGDTRPALVVSGLTLTRGRTADRGAVAGTGTDLTLDRVVVSDSQTSGAGGGVSVEGGSLLVRASSVIGNDAHNVDYYEGQGFGGGIFFDDDEAEAAALTIEDSTISGNAAGRSGGGIESRGPAVVVRSTVRDNRAASALLYASESVAHFGAGGGIHGEDLTVIESDIAGNSALLNGGGLMGRAVVVRRSTLADNVAGSRGGGVHVNGVVRTDDELRVESSTVSGNRADTGGAVYVGSDMPAELTLSTVASNAAVTGGGVFANTDVTLQGTIIAMNAGADLAGSGGALIDHSLVRDLRGFPYVDGGGAVLGQDPRLGPLVDNGGPTPTMLPASNSPALDRGKAYGRAADQRGSSRSVDDVDTPDAADASDIGALELTAAEASGLPRVGNVYQPTVTYNTQVGETLRVFTNREWEPRPVSLGYQWLRDGVPIPGATSSTYTLTSDDFGQETYAGDDRKRISVLVTASKAGHLEGSVLSDFTDYITAGDVTVAAPARVTGKARVGSTLRARPHRDAMSPRPSRVGISWYVDGRFVRDASNDTRLTLRPRMRGDRVEVRFRYGSPPGYRDLVQRVTRGPVR